MAAVRIAMWSGPRNLSTALMRSWGSRPDTAVTDEPLYAHYLAATGAPHPDAQEVIAAGDTDWRRVTAWLVGPPPDGRPIWFQKHMAHHLLPHVDIGWVDQLNNAFLIRDPAEVVPSLGRVLAEPALPDTGLPQQVALFEREADRTRRTPPVVDARDLLADPGTVLSALCDALGAPFDDAMLTWEPGPRPTDGIWAKHWYAGVEASTGFVAPAQPSAAPAVPQRLVPLVDACRPYYELLHRHRLGH